jgi:hypothetical protein
VLAVALSALLADGLAYDVSASLPGTLGGAIVSAPPLANPMVLKITPPFVAPASADPSAWYIWANSATNPGDATRMNPLLNIGYNCAKGGGTQASNIAGPCILLEGYWDDGGGFAQPEMHFAFVHKDSTQTRFITARFRLDTNKTDVTYNANSITFNTEGTSDQWMVASSQALNFGTTFNGIYFNRNNTGQLQFLNAAGNAYRSTLKLNGTDQVELGDASTNGVLLAGSSTGKFLDMPCGTEPAAPADGKARLWCNSAAKDQFCVRFQSGASQCVATEP